MTHSVQSTYYRIPIWDAALPAFASGQSCAYGTADDIRRFMEERARVVSLIPHDGGDDDLLMAYGKWRDGESPTVNIAYQDSPFATAVTGVLFRTHIEEGTHDETYMNTYGFPYYVHADSVAYDVLLVRQGDRFLRLIKADIRGMTIGDGASNHLVSSYWGEPGILEIHRDGNLSSTMFLLENAYEDEAEARRSLTGDDIALSIAPVMNHVVADG